MGALGWGRDGNTASVNPFTGVVAPLAGDGGAGLNVISGKALLAGGSAIGGTGGTGAFANGACFAPGKGGPGIRVAGVLQRLDSVATAGAGGAGVAGCPNGVSGTTIVQVGSGTVTTIADTLRRFEVSTPIHEGTSALNTILGVPGEVVLLLVAFSPDGTLVSSVHGALVGSGPFLSVLLGPLPANGALTFSVPVGVGTVPAAIEGILLYEQIIVAGASGFGLLGTPSAVTIVR